MISMLTERKIEVLELMARGFSNREIAAHLGIAGSTVKTHAEQIYQTLGVANRAEAVAVLVSARRGE